MKRFFSIITVFTIVALCVSPLFFPSDELKAQAPTEQVVDSPFVAPATTEATAAEIKDAVTYKVVSTEAPNEVVLVEVPDPAGIFEKVWEWFQKNGAAGLSIFISLLGLIEIIVRLTPSKRDDAAFDWLRKFVDAIIPNLKKGGGTFPAPKA